MWVKICGTTNLEDALTAVEAGADALGFIFAESRRRVTVEQARAMVRELPNEIEKIGVFVNAGSEEVIRVADEVGLTGVQLHGVALQAVAELLTASGTMTPFSITIAFSLSGDVTLGIAKCEPAPPPLAAELRFLFDSGSETQAGGTGRRFFWDRYESVIRSSGLGVKTIVAGGLTAQNVSEAITRFQPWGVDVATGVESAPGKKDLAKVRAFVKAAKG